VIISKAIKNAKKRLFFDEKQSKRFDLTLLNALLTAIFYTKDDKNFVFSPKNVYLCTLSE
jgi:hypothetical protein